MQIPVSCKISYFVKKKRKNPQTTKITTKTHYILYKHYLEYSYYTDQIRLTDYCARALISVAERLTVEPDGTAARLRGAGQQHQNWAKPHPGGTHHSWGRDTATTPSARSTPTHVFTSSKGPNLSALVIAKKWVTDHKCRSAFWTGGRPPHIRPAVISTTHMWW